LLIVVCADFRNREEELKSALATSRSKVRDLELRVQEIEAGGLELKQAMEEATAVSTPYLKSWLMRYQLVGALKSSSRLF
jgi:hypothetical protein